MVDLTSDDIRTIVLRRDGYKCQYCGTTDAQHYIYEHVIPRSWGGPFTPYNIVMACAGCNISKGSTVRIPMNLDVITAEYAEWGEYIRAYATARIERTTASYLISEDVGKRLRKLAHDRDLPIGHVAEAAFLAYLAAEED